MYNTIGPRAVPQEHEARLARLLAIYKLIEQISDVDLEVGQECYAAAWRVLERQRFRPDRHPEQRAA